MVSSAELHSYSLELTFLANSTAMERGKNKGREQVQEAHGYVEDGYITDFLGEALDRFAKKKEIELKAVKAEV